MARSKVVRRLLFVDKVSNAELLFAPVRKVPGFSHRVVINGNPVDWLSNESKPNTVSAAGWSDSLEKHLLSDWLFLALLRSLNVMKQALFPQTSKPREPG